MIIFMCVIDTVPIDKIGTVIKHLIICKTERIIDNFIILLVQHCFFMELMWRENFLV